MRLTSNPIKFYTMKNFLRKKNVAALAVLAMSAVCMIVQSCRSDDGSDLPEARQQKSMTKSAGTAFASWEAELNQGIRFGMERLRQQGLSLTGFELRSGTIAVAALAADRIETSTKIPVYDDPDDINAFTLQPFGDLNEELRESYTKSKALRFENCSEENVKVVIMTWLYKGEKFETECYVTDERIVYDPIASHIRFISYDTPVIAPRPTIKPKSEPGDTYKLNKSYNNNVNYQGFSGSIVASASVYVTLQGNTNSEGQKCVENFTAEAPYFADPFYGANSQIQVKSFQPGPNGYIEFDYAIGVSGWGGSISFQYSPSTGFTLPSGVNGRTGTIRISANELQ